MHGTSVAPSCPGGTMTRQRHSANIALLTLSGQRKSQCEVETELRALLGRIRARGKVVFEPAASVLEHHGRQVPKAHKVLGIKSEQIA